MVKIGGIDGALYCYMICVLLVWHHISSLLMFRFNLNIFNCFHEQFLTYHCDIKVCVAIRFAVGVPSPGGMMQSGRHWSF